MSQTTVYRLITPVLFTRVEVPIKGSILDLKKAVENISKIPASQQELYLDNRYQKKIAYSDSTPMNKLNLRQGDPIFLKNTPAKIGAMLTARSIISFLQNLII